MLGTQDLCPKTRIQILDSGSKICQHPWWWTSFCGMEWCIYMSPFYVPLIFFKEPRRHILLPFNSLQPWYIWVHWSHLANAENHTIASIAKYSFEPWISTPTLNTCHVIPPHWLLNGVLQVAITNYIREFLKHWLCVIVTVGASPTSCNLQINWFILWLVFRPEAVYLFANTGRISA